MKYWNHCECPHCGSSLDFGERCSCLDDRNQKMQEMKSEIDDSEPQLRFSFAVEHEEKEKIA
ncbi:MAG: hypothetical protein J5929_09685 [Eubacterium sp.]|nr:hypothetical protein [Eubacterium sp.]